MSVIFMDNFKIVIYGIAIVLFVNCYCFSLKLHR